MQRKVSKTRRTYTLKLIARIVILALCGLLWWLSPESFDVLDGLNFFRTLSPLHLLWALWIVDMILQVTPVKDKIALGSQKHFAIRFRPIREKINHQRLRDYIITTTKAAYKVLILWVALTVAIGALYLTGVIGRTALFMISVLFYVCDLICVLIWCPFRLIMKNKCCTTCRIFNWDHLMMFSPLIFMGGFFSVSLVLFAIAVWLIWELCVMLYPERFCEATNAALKCSECTDKLCTQYCQKLRK